MKFLDKFALKLFSLIIFVLGIGIILIMTGVLPLDAVLEEAAVLTDIGDYELKITIVVLAVIMLLALKGLFFTSKPQDNGKNGIILENTSGKLVISKESLENLIASVTKEIPGADTVASRTILDKDRNLIVYVTAVVSKDVMIKDISNELQRRIKDAMKRTADLDVKEVNIRIKNITSKKVKGLPSTESTNETPVEDKEQSETSEENENHQSEEV